MGSKKKVPLKAAKGGPQRGKQAAAAAAPNPFALKGTRRKFEVLGRREKTGKKNVLQAREAAVAKVR